MAKREKDPKSEGMSRVTLVAMTVVMVIILGILIIQSARRLVMVFEAAG